MCKLKITGVIHLVDFQWNNSTDPDGDVITYQIQVSKDNQFNQIAQTLLGSQTNQSISLEKGVAYYWSVKAIDRKSASSSYSSVFNFYTEGTGETNHIPFSPELIQPALNSVLQTATATLSWNASDVDTSDALTFDVYFGTANLPTEIIGNNQTSKTLNVNLVSSTNYYLKVVVKDNNGGETIGQVWNFKTD
ncbi:MAG: hypothetical protein JKY16_03165 [Lutibacter sp.]|nr:hypothetical protein [Lutibacter sp.]